MTYFHTYSNTPTKGASPEVFKELFVGRKIEHKRAQHAIDKSAIPANKRNYGRHGKTRGEK